MKKEQPCKLEAAAATQSSRSFPGGFRGFLKFNKKCRLAPAIAIFLILGLLILPSNPGTTPFICTLF
jgi:hypothetical protein